MFNKEDIRFTSNEMYLELNAVAILMYLVLIQNISISPQCLTQDILIRFKSYIFFVNANDVHLCDS